MEAVEEVEMVPVVVTTPMEVVVEAATVPVKVVEAEPSSGTCRHSAQEVHSVRAPPGPEPEEPVSVVAPDDAGTPAPGRRSVQEASGPRMAQREAPGRCEARQRVPEPRVALRESPGPRVAWQRAPGLRVA
jgi:hypothetical protein